MKRLVTQFKDKCIITRYNGAVDEYGKPLGVEIYNDKCLFQGGGQTSLSNVTHNDVVYLPTNDGLIETGDSIRVTNQRGRVREGIVKVANDIIMPKSHLELTEVEIRRSKDINN